jgi:hypothetical protein
MYGLADLKKAARNPHVALRECNRLYHRRLFTRPYNTEGVDVFAADWDTLVVLDACRYDTFRERADLPGDLEKRESRGAATPEFVRANFADRDLHDLVYVSRNTWFLKLRDELGCEVFDFRLTTARSPIETTETAIEALDDHPDKRLLVHYLPPHHPFVGPTADERFPDYEAQADDLFERIQRGDLDISDAQLRRAYAENLDRVLPEVERLFDELEGRTVVTADHGELLGDVTRPVPVRDYGHHVGLYTPELVEVPWLVHESGERREVVAETPTGREDVDEDVVDQRLRDLGYKV